MSTTSLAKYLPLVSEALVAYRIDYSYAEDMARQATALLARREAKQERDSIMETAA